MIRNFFVPNSSASKSLNLLPLLLFVSSFSTKFPKLSALFSLSLASKSESPLWENSKLGASMSDVAESLPKADSKKINAKLLFSSSKIKK